MATKKGYQKALGLALNRAQGLALLRARQKVPRKVPGLASLIVQ